MLGRRFLLDIAEYLDTLVNGVTMYRLLVYYLLAILATAMILGATGRLSYSPVAIAISTAYLVFVCWVTNKIFGRIFETPVNPESSILSGLILALLITPLANPQNFVFLTAAAGLATASKYLLAIRKKHIFNPAAVAVALTALGAGDTASWWVGTAWLMPVVLVGGILLARKIHRGVMVTTFFGVSLISAAVLGVVSGSNIGSAISQTILQSSMLFLGFVMLTEPLTSPVTQRKQQWYAAIVAILMQPQIHIGAVYTSPEIALVIGNVFSYIVSPKAKALLTPRRIARWGASTKDFIFDRGDFTFTPGQYMEFTLPHSGMDSRGARRIFTLASAPTEKNLRIGVRFYPKGSSFKRALLNSSSNTVIGASGLGGDFVLPEDETEKLAFIAGGIGVTPFRSMIKYALDTGEKRNIRMIYSDKTLDDFAYGDVFNEAQKQPHIHISYTITNKGEKIPPHFYSGTINREMVAKAIPDFADRTFYISGPHIMVTEVEKLLATMGVAPHRIKVDFFPGYA